jgi:CheY-like chemotaxis protein
MREMNGDEVFQLLRGLQPELPVILLSGYAADETAQRFSSIGLAGFVHKPFAQDELMSALQKAMTAAI